jgi:modification methylase
LQIAAHAIRTYTRPGDLVLDPMCGIGTTIHLGRSALDGPSTVTSS